MAAGAAVAFGTLAIFAKLGYDEGADPFPLLATRFWVTSGLLVAFHLVTSRTLMIGRRDVIRLMLLGAVGYAFESALFFAALERAPAGVVGLIFYSYPLWTTLIAFIARIEPLRARTVIALCLGSAGVLLISSIRGTGLAGPLLALASAVAVAVYLVVAQVVVRGVASSAAAAWTAVGAALTLSVASIVAPSELPAAALPAAGALGLATAIAFMLLYAAITRIGSARTAVANMLEPVTTVALAAVVLGEAITYRKIAGAALVVSSLPVLASTGRKERTAAAPDSL
jgi:drug/metabolite transporter (DMT)-like permease